MGVRVGRVVRISWGTIIFVRVRVGTIIGIRGYTFKVGGRGYIKIGDSLITFKVGGRGYVRIGVR